MLCSAGWYNKLQFKSFIHRSRFIAKGWAELQLIRLNIQLPECPPFLHAAKYWIYLIDMCSYYINNILIRLLPAWATSSFCLTSTFLVIWTFCKHDNYALLWKYALCKLLAIKHLFNGDRVKYLTHTHIVQRIITSEGAKIWILRRYRSISDIYLTNDYRWERIHQ